MDKINSYFTNRIKVIIGVCLIFLGVLVSYAVKGTGTAGNIGYLVSVGGFICLINALFSKISKCNIGFLLGVLGSIVGAEIAIQILYGFDFEFSAKLIAILVLIVVLIWALHVYLIQIPGICKRMVLGFLATLLIIIAMVGGVLAIAILTK